MNNIEASRTAMVTVKWIISDLKKELEGYMDYDNVEWFMRYFRNLLNGLKDQHIKLLEANATKD